MAGAEAGCTCASPESHKVSEWGHRCLSRLRFLRPKGRPPLIHSRPVSSQHARLDSTLSGVSRHPVPLSGWDGGRELRPAASARHPPSVEARPSSPYFVGPSPLGLRPSPLSRVATESGHRQARDRHRVASPVVSTLLEMEISGRATESAIRGPTAYSGDGIRQPDLGCAPNPRRAS
jgi:hypothetical protein